MQVVYQNQDYNYLRPPLSLYKDIPESEHFLNDDRFIYYGVKTTDEEKNAIAKFKEKWNLPKNNDKNEEFRRQIPVWWSEGDYL